MGFSQGAAMAALLLALVRPKVVVMMSADALLKTLMLARTPASLSIIPDRRKAPCGSSVRHGLSSAS